ELASLHQQRGRKSLPRCRLRYASRLNSGVRPHVGINRFGQHWGDAARRGLDRLRPRPCPFVRSSGVWPASCCEFDVMWHDHDLGSYPSLGIWSESSDPGAYFAKAEAALICFDDAVDWPTIKEHLARSLDETEEDGDEA